MKILIQNFILFLIILISSSVKNGHASEKTVCYPSLIDPPDIKTRIQRSFSVGVIDHRKHCYSTAAPFDDLPLPEDPNEIAPTYHLFDYDSVKNQTSSKIINDSRLVSTDNRLVILIHGFLDTFENTAEWHAPIVNNLFLMMPTIQILYVEWAKGASLHYSLNPYAQPSSNTRVIGDCLADFLQSNQKLDPKRIHCLGFSLGSHVCGFFAKRYISPYKIWRVTGLDPANMHFNKNDPTARLDRADAIYVDTIHTSRLGLERAIGSVDFYANNAKWQPGCSVISKVRKLKRRSVVENPIDDLEDALACSHHRAPFLFAISILLQPGSKLAPDNCTFSNFCPCTSLEDFTHGLCKTKCANAPMLGYWSYLAGKPGAFYGATGSLSPYCLV